MTNPIDIDALRQLMERLREEALSLHRGAWSRPDGGQDCTIAGQLADEAADAIEAMATELEALRASRGRVVVEWQPRIGEEVRLTQYFLDQYPDWKPDERFYVAGVCKGRNSGYPIDGLNVTLSDEWPPDSRTGGYTDGFYINRQLVPDDIAPAAVILPAEDCGEQS